MACQDHEADRGRAEREIGDGAVCRCALLLLLAHDDLDGGQDQRQPDGGGDKHGEDDADDEEAAEHEDDAGQQGSRRAQAQHAAQHIHVHAGQCDLQRGEPAIGQFERKRIEEHAQRVEDAGLARSEKGQACENLRVPQGELAFSQGAADVQLPDRVLQYEVAEQLVVRHELRLQAAVGLEGVEVVVGQERAAGERGEEDR